MSDDTIKRSDAIEALNECTDIKGFEYTQMHNALMEVPSADRPQGEWIGGRVGHSPGYTCSICGYGVQPWNNTNYCPRCGAQMKGTDDESTL